MDQRLPALFLLLLAAAPTVTLAAEDPSRKTPSGAPAVPEAGTPEQPGKTEPTQEDIRRRLEAVEKELAEMKKAEPPKSSSESPVLQASWKDGLRFDSRDQNVQVQIGGRIQNDWAWFHEDEELIDEVGNSQDGTQFRRARLQMQGLLYKRLEFKAEYEFARRAGTGEVGGPGFRDVYLGVVDVPYA